MHASWYRTATSVAALTLALAATGCGGPDGRTTEGARGPARTAVAQAAPPQPPAAPALPGWPAGLGPRTAGMLPDDTEQVLVVTGESERSPLATAVLHELTPEGWRAGPAWPAHNALDGWTDEHWEDDLRTPRGVFTLTDAGGRADDPGSLLPYDRSEGFVVEGDGFDGEPLEGSFDYVVAINYNRVPGTSPLDRSRPLGPERGGGIWLHIDHGGPTHGCVALREGDMVELLRRLDPARHPAIAMGDAAYLAP